MATSSQPTNNDSRDSWFTHVRHGRLMSVDFFARNWVTVLTVIIMFLIYITNKYQCQTRMETIQSLQHRLEIVKTECVLQHSHYMSRTRESAMRELVDTMHLGLSARELPPYKITNDEN